MTLVDTDTRQAALARLREAVGPKGWVEAADAGTYLTDWRGLYHGRAAAVVRPGSTAEVAAVVRLCHEAGIAVVPQGGNTGLVGGSVPHEDGAEILLSTDRLTRIRDLDPLDNTVTVEAGVVLQQVQEAAAEADRLFPLSMGAEGSCRIGGNLATNAGGNAVLRYGNARELVLGLEVVLPDGQVWDGLRRLRKDNTGYDLKQLFIGAEGTLGVITAAVLRLFPRPRQREAALVAVPDPAAAVALLARMRAGSGDAVTAFELIQRQGIDFALAHVPGTPDPLEAPYDWYVLVELTSPVAGTDLRDKLEAVLEEAFETELVVDGAVAASDTQMQAFWALREAIVEGQARLGPQVKHDVSVPVSRVPAFLEQAAAAVAAALPGVRVNAFGHVGDGNIHFNLSPPEGLDAAAFAVAEPGLTGAVYDAVAALDGSISAEHGIGRLKRGDLAARKAPLELDLMRRIKRAFDPDGLMNPGKVLP
jgi:FAD/FMN-containing dehydrogenase